MKRKSLRVASSIRAKARATSIFAENVPSGPLSNSCLARPFDILGIAWSKSCWSELSNSAALRMAGPVSLLNFSMGSASFTLVGKASQQARLKLMPSVFAKMQDCKTMISLAALSEIFRRRDARSIVST